MSQKEQVVRKHVTWNYYQALLTFHYRNKVWLYPCYWHVLFADGFLRRKIFLPYFFTSKTFSILSTLKVLIILIRSDIRIIRPLSNHWTVVILDHLSYRKSQILWLMKLIISWLTDGWNRLQSNQFFSLCNLIKFHDILKILQDETLTSRFFMKSFISIFF